MPFFTLLQYLTLGTAGVFLAAYLVAQFRTKGVAYDEDTIRRLKSAYESLEIENKELRKQVTEMQAAILQLQQSNSVLQGIVTGKDTLSFIQKHLVELDKTVNKKLDLLVERRESERRKNKPHA